MNEWRAMHQSDTAVLTSALSAMSAQLASMITTTQDIFRANWSPFRKCHLKPPLKRRRKKQDMKVATQDPIMPTIKTAAQYFSQIQGRSAQNCKSIAFVIHIYIDTLIKHTDYTFYKKSVARGTK